MVIAALWYQPAPCATPSSGLSPSQAAFGQQPICRGRRPHLSASMRTHFRVRNGRRLLNKVATFISAWERFAPSGPHARAAPGRLHHD